MKIKLALTVALKEREQDCCSLLPQEKGIDLWAFKKEDEGNLYIHSATPFPRAESRNTRLFSNKSGRL